jgi:hypothetical protein
LSQFKEMSMPRELGVDEPLPKTREEMRAAVFGPVDAPAAQAAPSAPADAKRKLASIWEVLGRERRGFFERTVEKLTPGHRAYLEDQLSKMTPQEAHQQLAMWLAQGIPPQPREKIFEGGSPSPPHLLEGSRCQLSGRPLDEEAFDGEFRPAAAARHARNMKRFRDWAELSAMAKTQIVADLRWGQEENPMWVCQIVGGSSDAPVIVLRAASPADACERYLRLCGVTGLAGHLRADAAPYSEVAR